MTSSTIWFRGPVLWLCPSGVALPLNVRVGKGRWKCHIHILKSWSGRDTSLCSHPWVRIHRPAWIREELGSISPGQAATVATILHEGEVVVGRQLPHLLKADLLTSLLLRNILAFPNLLALPSGCSHLESRWLLEAKITATLYVFWLKVKYGSFTILYLPDYMPWWVLLPCSGIIPGGPD